MKSATPSKEIKVRRNGLHWTVSKKVNGLTFERHFMYRWQAWQLQRQWREG